MATTFSGIPNMTRYVTASALGAGLIGAAALGFAANAGAGTEFPRHPTTGTSDPGQPGIDSPGASVEPEVPPAGWQGKKQLAPAYPRGSAGAGTTMRSPVWRWFHDPARVDGP